MYILVTNVYKHFTYTHNKHVYKHILDVSIFFVITLKICSMTKGYNLMFMYLSNMFTKIATMFTEQKNENKAYLLS